jgi:hypothetical protein
MVALIEQYGGWLDASAVGYARQTEMARRMLDGEIDPHLEPNDFSGHTVAEQLLWGGASSRSIEITRMALDHVDWAADDPRWFGMLWRPLPGHEDLDERQQAESIECVTSILARCGPHHRWGQGQTMLHEVVARDHGVGVALATILLDAGARRDVRDDLLRSTPLAGPAAGDGRRSSSCSWREERTRSRPTPSPGPRRAPGRRRCATRES